MEILRKDVSAYTYYVLKNGLFTVGVFKYSEDSKQYVFQSHGWEDGLLKHLQNLNA